ncbi:MAG TPA: ATP-dependent Clp protease proteolytic subunit [Caldithrix abyssi]|uniref:ATP-dependent Clp protease proteolytic subunit n=1 Tax=Caldithrix abyssi TaxID=187145 RepID=A0A7V1LMG9_CALAY|nr:ATP-dependent Clp protease proteolytic subunit [Caldithrix abyssi]
MESQEKEDEKKPDILKKINEQFIEKRQIFLWGPVDDDSAKAIVAKLLFMEAEKPGEVITFFINSPGGMVTSGMAIYDTMKLISSPVHTVCMGLAASMGSILLSAGEKGHRFIYPHGEVMIHQPSIGRLIGAASDIKIHAEQIVKTRELGAKILAENCGQKVEKVLKDFDRDYWMDADESIKYGIVDKVYSM